MNSDKNEKYFVKISLSSDDFLKAIQEEREDVLSFLLEKGLSKYVETPFSTSGHSKWDNFIPLEVACVLGNPKIAKLLILAGADVNQKLSSGGTSLLPAIRSGNKELFDFLIFKGASFSHDQKGRNAAFYAVLGGHLTLALRLLHKHKVNPLDMDKDGFDVGMCAVSQNPNSGELPGFLVEFTKLKINRKDSEES